MSVPMVNSYARQKKYQSSNFSRTNSSKKRTEFGRVGLSSPTSKRKGDQMRCFRSASLCHAPSAHVSSPSNPSADSEALWGMLQSLGGCFVVISAALWGRFAGAFLSPIFLTSFKTSLQAPFSHPHSKTRPPKHSFSRPQPPCRSSPAPAQNKATAANQTHQKPLCRLKNPVFRPQAKGFFDQTKPNSSAPLRFKFQVSSL